MSQRAKSTLIAVGAALLGIGLTAGAALSTFFFALVSGLSGAASSMTMMLALSFLGLVGAVILNMRIIIPLIHRHIENL